jgi:hypothetical protein
MSGCCWLPLINPITGRPVDHRLKALAHQILKLHPLVDDRRAAAALQQRLLDREKPPPAESVPCKDIGGGHAGLPHVGLIASSQGTRTKPRDTPNGAGGETAPLPARPTRRRSRSPPVSVNRGPAAGGEPPRLLITHAVVRGRSQQPVRPRLLPRISHSLLVPEQLPCDQARTRATRLVEARDYLKHLLHRNLINL